MGKTDYSLVFLLMLARLSLLLMTATCANTEVSMRGELLKALMCTVLQIGVLSGTLAGQEASETPSNPPANKEKPPVICGTTDKDYQGYASIKGLLESKTSPDVLENLVRSNMGRIDVSPEQLLELKKAGASDDLLLLLTTQSDVYIGWTVLPAKIVRDNYGQFVQNKYFAIDVAIANRNERTSLVITALEFCHGGIRDVSQDPVLVRGSLQKGEMTGARNTASRTIQAVGNIASPSAAFFKNELHRGTFSAFASLFTPLKSGFDLVFPNTILTYLENWDKDEVFRKGFIVAAGGSTRGRVFIPIELIYPRPKERSQAPDAYQLWRDATKGRFDPQDVKRRIGSLVVLGQEITLGQQHTFFPPQ
jgi:hypothetical protein